jgi:hypothetical protein
MATQTQQLVKSEVGQAFLERYAGVVLGILHGWDRLRLQGTLRSLYYVPVMEQYLRAVGVLWKDFKRYAVGMTGRVSQTAEAVGKEQKRPLIYLTSSRISKEDRAWEIQRRDKIKQGLIAVISCVEPCRTWRMRGDHESKRLELRLEWGKCKHYYFYWMHEELGFLHLRLQTWFPYLIQVCVNGREWLARQMDRGRMKYRKEDNCFTWISDIGRAQKLMEKQTRIDWEKVLGELVKRCHRLDEEIRKPIEAEYYWSAAQSEYAADVMFRGRAALERIYGPLVHHAVMSYGAEQVMRYVGRPGRVGIHDQVVTDRRRREEGVRVKHWLNQNSIKIYDKGSVLRNEVTINEPKDFRVWRAAENQPEGKKQWRVLRRSVVDFGRRAEVSRKATDRYLSALATVEVRQTLAQGAVEMCRAIKRDGQRYRGLNPLGAADAELLAAVNRGEFAINGFRNRDIRQSLYGVSKDKAKERKHMAAVGRKLRLLRGHGLISKVSKTHRYVVTVKGRRMMTALLAARQASTEKLMALAA